MIILKRSKILVVIRFHRLAKWQCILPSNAKTLLGLFCNLNCIHLCSHITLSSSSNVNIVEWFVSMPAVRLFACSALTISFGSACRGYTFDRSAFNVLFQKVQGLGFTFMV